MVFVCFAGFPSRKEERDICKNYNCKRKGKDFCLECRKVMKENKVKVYMCEDCEAVYLVEKDGNAPIECKKCRSLNVS